MTEENRETNKLLRELIKEVKLLTKEHIVHFQHWDEKNGVMATYEMPYGRETT
jgi:hypothetical protein